MYLDSFFSSKYLINRKDEKNSGAFQTLEAPFGSDNMSAWERDNVSFTEKEKVNKLCNDLLLLFAQVGVVRPNRRVITE